MPEVVCLLVILQWSGN